MKYENVRSLSLVLVLLSVTIPAYGFLRGRSFFSPRSQSTHAERELVGWTQEINLCSDMFYGAFSVMPIYSRSIHANEISDYLFGASSFVISGSRSQTNRGSQELLADYFGLPLDYLSTICFKPLIHNFLVDFNMYLGLDEWYPGLYFRAHAPVGSTTWDMRLCEAVINRGSQSYPAGYMASSEVPRSDIGFDMLEYFRGIRTVGDMHPLQYGKINGACTKTGISDIQCAFGWNFIECDEYHFGLNVRTAVPTGNHSRALVMFEPILGNGGHWEFGIGMTGHSFFWESECGEHVFSIYGDMNLMHLFASRQKRSFDLKKNGPGSRYILIQEIGTPVVQGLTVGGTPALAQYHGATMPAINKTTFDADISIALQVDAVLDLSYNYASFRADIGYDLWARTAERICRKECLSPQAYAVKGDAQLYGFTQDTSQFIALNATQSDATIHAGQGDGNANLNFQNLNADNAVINDNPVLAQFNGVFLTQMFNPIALVSASDQAIFLDDADIDNLSAASPSALSHTFFVHLSYVWDCIDELMTPYFGGGGELTINGSGQKRNNALSEWALWVKGGVSF